MFGTGEPRRRQASKHSTLCSIFQELEAMNVRLPLLLVFSAVPTIAIAQYRSDWNAENFYDQLHWCRSLFVLADASNYERKALSAGKTAEMARAEAIAVTPASEAIASATCYCAINVLAKDMTFASFRADKSKIAGYVESSQCKAATAQAMRVMSAERATELRLK